MNEKINAFESVLDLIGNTPLIKLNKVKHNKSTIADFCLIILKKY